MIMGLQETFITYNNSLFRFFYLCHYLPLIVGPDTLSRSLLKFKRGIQPDLDAWIECSLEVFPDIPLSPGTTIVRALRHGETKVPESTPTSLDLLGQTLAANFHCRYLPSLLCKSRPTLSNKGLTREQRHAELKDVYSLSPEVLSSPLSTTSSSPVPSNPAFLLIDDIFTTGTTVRMIIHTLRGFFPLCPLQIFTLAKADYAPNSPSRQDPAR
jgi:predicted amidophosphoribosyltransferase